MKPDFPERGTRIPVYLGMTRSTCPICLELVDARLLMSGNRLFLRKFCPDHAISEVLISEDARRTLASREYARAGSIPLHFNKQSRSGCPDDCGLCPEHQQHTCHPIVEVTEQCNLACPVCIVPRRHSGFLSPARYAKIIENLIAAEGRLENVTLSGGEPLLHPSFRELIHLSRRPEIGRVSVATNGVLLAQEPEWCRRLAGDGVYVLLQWDGFDDEVYRYLRGRELWTVKQRALDHLSAAGVPVQLIFVAARGVNDHQLGQAVDLLLARDNILSLAIQPLAVPDRNRTGPAFGRHRITIPGVIQALAEQTGGLLCEDDFFPLPCSNPECVSLTYLLRLEDGGYIPFPRFVDIRRYLAIVSQSATLEPGRPLEEALHGIISGLWSTGGEIPDSGRIQAALRRALDEIFRLSPGDSRRMARAAERQAKSIFIHHYMDAETFDQSRVIKCCHHYPRPDGSIMPVCTFNLFHRRREENPYDA